MAFNISGLIEKAKGLVGSGKVSGAISNIAGGGQIFQNDDSGIFGGALKRAVNNMVGGGNTQTAPTRDNFDQQHQTFQQKGGGFNDPSKKWYMRPVTWVIGGVLLVGGILVAVFKGKRRY